MFFGGMREFAEWLSPVITWSRFLNHWSWCEHQCTGWEGKETDYGNAEREKDAPGWAT